MLPRLRLLFGRQLTTVVNRLDRTDSEVSLDVCRLGDHGVFMATHLFNLHCHRIDDKSRMQRFYILSLRKTLFGDIAVTRCWGRIGSRGREKTDIFVGDQEAVNHFLELACAKRRRGYRPVSR